MKTSFLAFSCSHCSCTIFNLTSYFLYTQVMLLLILTDVQYLQKVVFSFEQGLNGQNNSSWITTSLSSLLVKQSCLLFSWPNHGSLLFCKHFFMSKVSHPSKHHCIIPLKSNHIFITGQFPYNKHCTLIKNMCFCS